MGQSNAKNQNVIFDQVQSNSNGPVEYPAAFSISNNQLAYAAWVLNQIAIGTSGIPQIQTEITGGATPNSITVYYLVLTASGSGTTSASDGTVTNQASITVTGSGSGAYFTVTTVSNLATSVRQTNPGSGYNIGDTFTIAALPGITFTITNITTMVNPGLIFRTSAGNNYAGAVNNVDTGTSIVLTGDDDGSGHFADSFTFIIKP